MKYQTTPVSSNIDDRGFAQNDGWTLVYRWLPNGEYYKADWDWTVEGTGVPAQSTTIPPDFTKGDDVAIVRENDEWVYYPDYRGKKVYSVETGEPTVVREWGDIPEGTTFLAPETEFDVWTGDSWEYSTEKHDAYYSQLNTHTRNDLLSEAKDQISDIKLILEYSEDSSELYSGLLKDWEAYLVKLKLLDMKLEVIDWPEKPAKS